MKKLIYLLLFIPFLFSGSSNNDDEPKSEYEGTYTNTEGYTVRNKSNFTVISQITSTCQFKGNTVTVKAFTNSKALFEKSITFTENRNYTDSITFYVGTELVGSFTPSKKTVIMYLDNQDTYFGYKVDFTCIYK